MTWTVLPCIASTRPGLGLGEVAPGDAGAVHDIDRARADHPEAAVIHDRRRILVDPDAEHAGIVGDGTGQPAEAAALREMLAGTER